ncbi:MAG: sodium:solute symporter family protein [Eubacteriales bacterium]
MTQIGIIVLYLVITLYIGFLASKKSKKTLADLFIANKSLGILALSMALFGGMVTSFGILGGPGVGYSLGYSSLGYMVGMASFAPALGYYLIGYRAWLLTDKFNYITPVEFFGDRFGNNLARYIIGSLQIIFEIPYLLIMGIGSGVIITTVTGGLVPYWLGALVILIISAYTAYSGGMRGTAWTNIFQGTLMLVVMFVMVFTVYKALGGGAAITQQLSQEMISLNGQGVQQLGQWIPYSIFVTGITGGVTAHLLVRNMSAASAKTLQRNSIIFPILIGGFWILAIILGVWGKVAVPGLDKIQAENIVPMMANMFAPQWIVGLLGAGILSAIMSSWDGMILVSSSIFSEDIIKPILRKRKVKLTDEQEHKMSRNFIIILSVVIYILTLLRPASILSIATFSFVGFSSLFPLYFAILYWKRTTLWGVVISAIVTTIFVILWTFNILPGWTTFGIHYSALSFSLSLILVVIISLITKPASKSAVEEFFSAYNGVYEKK